MRRTIFQSEHEIFRDQARRFVQTEIAPHAERWRHQGYVDREAYRHAGENGYLLMWADERYGGAGVVDFRYEQIFYEENVRYGDIGFFATVHSRLIAPYIGHLGTDEQKQRILPGCVRGDTILGIAMTEPDTGSDLRGIRTIAKRTSGGWILRGAKTYISNGQIGDLFIVVARSGTESRNAFGLFLVERGMQGFRRGRNLEKIGLKAQDTSELFFDDVEVPDANVLGDPTRGFEYLTTFLAEERLLSAIASLAAAQTAFDLTLDYIKERRAFGRPIGSFQNSRFKMADQRASLDAVQALIDHAVMEHNAAALSPVLAAEAKLLASELENRVAAECLQLHGSAGYMLEYRIARLFTDARISTIYAGTSEIMREIIGRSLGLDERTLR
jgi:acyl-CoA dehydrogenase